MAISDDAIQDYVVVGNTKALQEVERALLKRRTEHDEND